MKALIGLAAAAIGAAAALTVARPGRRAPRDQAELAAAVAAVDRELAANLELTSMFDQTRQAVVLENGQFEQHGATIARHAPQAHAEAAALYAAMPAAESAMERRGPANTFGDDDRRIVEDWEGDARTVQASLREAAIGPGPSLLDRALARLVDRWRTG